TTGGARGNRGEDSAVNRLAEAGIQGRASRQSSRAGTPGAPPEDFDPRHPRSAAQTARSRRFDAVVGKQVYFTASAVFSAPFFTPLPVSLAAVFVAAPVLSAAFSVALPVSLAAVLVAWPVFTAAVLVACPVVTAAFLVALPVSSAAVFTSVPAWPYENAVRASSAAAIIKENFIFIVPPEELKSSSVARLYQSMRGARNQELNFPISSRTCFDLHSAVP